MRYLRGVCGVTRRDCVRNEQVLEECGVKENVVQKVGKSALRWFGHVERMKDEELLKRVYVGRVDGKRGRGTASRYEYLKERKGMSQKKNVRKCARRGMSVSEAKEVCQDRKGWRKLLNG